MLEDRVVDAVDETEPERLLRVDRPAGQDQLLRHSQTTDAREPLRAAPARNDPEIDLGLAEPRRRSGVPKIAGERELAAAPEREAVDRGDRRLRHRLEQAPALVTESTPLLGLLDREAAHVLDVCSRDERLLARAGEDDDPRFGVARQFEQPAAQLLEGRPVERVHRLRPVDRDDRDPVLALDPNAQAGTFPFRNSTMSEVGAPGVKTAATPCERSSSASSFGIVPPRTPSPSSAPFSRSPSGMRGTT